MQEAAALEVEVFTSAGLQQNAYLALDNEEGVAVAVDPGGAANRLAGALERSDLQLLAILLTHAHYDHVEGVATLVEQTGAPVCLHPADLPLYRSVDKQAAWLGVPGSEPPQVDRELADGQEISVGRSMLQVLHVPGHSPGHVAFYSPEAGIAFVGDLVFSGSIGRSDLPGGDLEQLLASIRRRVLALPDETVLYPGHGPGTTVGHERVSNPFLVPDRTGGLA